METAKQIRVRNTLIRVGRGDITECDVDAIVNAANSHLRHGGGVAGAIVRKGGHIIQAESDKIGFVPVGGSAVTSAGSLKARFVIHTVGPRWGEGDEEEKLRKAVLSTLRLAAGRGMRSIAMPAISAGIFGFPKDRCAQIMVEDTAAFLAATETSLEEIWFCLMDEEIVGHFEAALDGVTAGQ